MKTYLPSGVVTPSAYPGLMVDRAAFDRALAVCATGSGAEIMTATTLGACDVALVRRQMRGDDVGPAKGHKSAASLPNSGYSR